MRYLFFSLALLAYAHHSFAYPNFVGFGYKNCLTCHYNPFGNGPLNDYGRAVSANVISDRIFVPKSVTDEDLGDRSNFFAQKKPVTSWIRPAYDWRNLYYEPGVEKSDSEGDTFIMQNEAHLTLKFGAGDKFIITGSYQTLPANNRFPGQEAEEYSREHYIGMRIGEGGGIYLGKMDKVYGIRIVDHIAYSRGGTEVSPEGKRHNLNLGFTSQVHGAVLHYGTDTYEMGYQYIMGDREKATEFHTTGHAFKYEHTVLEKLRLGGSFLTETSNDGTENQTMFAGIAKIQAGKGSSILMEYGNSTYEEEGATPYTSSYYLMQASVKMSRGLFLITTFEAVKPNVEEEHQVYRIAPGIQWFPIQRIEMRMDLQNKRVYTSNTAIEDTWNLLGQMHLWF
jgi:hypothetical protein